MVLFVNVETVRIFEEFGKEVCFPIAALVQITFPKGKEAGNGRREHEAISTPLCSLDVIWHERGFCQL